MAHLVLSRKYRPQRFEDLVGQEHVAQTLSNAIASGRIGHAYLFVGPRGTGKTTTARIFAKALNCERGPTPTPCGTCDSCVAVTQGNDLDVVEMDAASNNGVDDVRALRDSVGYRPARSRFRVWIVDEVHMLSLPAFNAFLKTLEEPPAQAKFLFCTTEAHKLPETFTSRVQRLEFRRIDEAKMAERLRTLAERERLVVEDGVCDRIASGALGGLRDAESLLEQLLSAAQDGRVTLADLDAVTGRAPADRVAAVFEAALAGDAGAALDAAGACLDGGGKPDTVLEQWVEALRAYLVRAAR
ncbi:MAG: DNA polymerase III subunit gamma/tau, partial [Planctomycetota bacterium]